MGYSSRLWEDYGAIRRAAQASDDGQRCAVAPHPDLARQLREELERLRSLQAGLLGTLLRAEEPRRVGLNDGLIIPPDQFPLGAPMSAIRSAAADRAPLRGTVRVIVVLVDFEDQPMTRPASHFQQLFFSEGQISTRSVREYFRDVTAGKIDIQGEVVGPYRLPRTMSEYAHGASGMSGAAPNAQTMALDTAKRADADVDFAPYDNDGNGYVDAFIVVHAGDAAEVTGDKDQIWSHKWVLNGGAYNADGTKIYAYLTVPEDARIGVCCHELGHLLFGFPDLYDTDYSSEGVGNWCLMAGGSWGGGGDTPCHPSAWCKANQGWVTVENRTTAGRLTIADVKDSHKVYRLWKDGALGSEYFLVENRQRAGFDASLPGDGLLIWHIDETMPGNSNESHYKVALVQADDRRDLELGRNRGDTGDSYPGSTGNRSLTGASRPNSRAYSGAPTYVSVTQISPSAPVMTADVRVSSRRSFFGVESDRVEERVAAIEAMLGGLADRLPNLAADRLGAFNLPRLAQKEPDTIP